MAHARRKFHDIHEAHPSPITTEALDRIRLSNALCSRSAFSDALKL
jgi:hypothetical protein